MESSDNDVQSAGPPTGETRAGLLIFVVDDESMIGEVVEVVLKLKGFRPKFFIDPEEALRALVNDEEKPVLLLTDFLMSPINGMELINQAKKILPSLKTVLCSGNVGEEMTQYYPVKPDGFLSKPFLPRNLIAVVQTALDLKVQ